MWAIGGSTSTRAEPQRASRAARTRRGRVVEALSIALICSALLSLVWIYATALRDPRYLDGWILAGGMVLQLYFHIAIKTASLSPRSIMRWRRIHVFIGYVLIAAFASHSDFSLPDTLFEWAIWLAFVLVALSGIFGTYLVWALPAKHGLNDRAGYAHFLAKRAELARDVRGVIDAYEAPAFADALPQPQFDAWLKDLYDKTLLDFFAGRRNVPAHLIGSQRHLKTLCDEIDELSRYVDQPTQTRLAAIRTLVIEKDRLDFASVYLGLTRSWLFIHVPVTYSLFVLTIFHIVVAYAFSSGGW